MNEPVDELVVKLLAREAVVDVLLLMAVQELPPEERERIAFVLDEGALVPPPPLPRDWSDQRKREVSEISERLTAQYYGEIAAKIRAL